MLDGSTPPVRAQVPAGVAPGSGGAAPGAGQRPARPYDDAWPSSTNPSACWWANFAAYPAHPNTTRCPITSGGVKDAASIETLLDALGVLALAVFTWGGHRQRRAQEFYKRVGFDRVPVHHLGRFSLAESGGTTANCSGRKPPRAATTAADRNRGLPGAGGDAGALRPGAGPRLQEPARRPACPRPPP